MLHQSWNYELVLKAGINDLCNHMTSRILRPPHQLLNIKHANLPHSRRHSMLLTEKQLQFYDDNGYLLVTECFSAREIEQMKTELPGIFAEDSPRRVVEKDGHTVRSVYGSHMDNPVFRHLVRDNRLLGPSRQLLKDEVYVYQ